MARVRREAEERPPVGLYVDEMHNYLALPRSFEDMLAEARGYGLGMVLAHQHMGQLTRDVRDALGANARTKISFAVSPEDASVLSRHFAPHLSDYDLANLAAFQAACRPCIGGAHGSPFTFRTTPLDAGSKKVSECVKAASAENFAHTQHEVDTDLKGRTGALEVELTDESVGESPAALRLDRQPVPVLPRKKR